MGFFKRFADWIFPPPEPVNIPIARGSMELWRARHRAARRAVLAKEIARLRKQKKRHTHLLPELEKLTTECLRGGA